MQNPNALPPRHVDLVTDEGDELAAAQPERRREYVRIRAGRFRGTLRERSDGVVAVGRENWDSALRVRCGRPRSYVVFSVVQTEQAATWCGIPLGRRSVLQLDRDWEITTHGALEACSFGVERGALERAEEQLAGAPEPARVENRLLALDGQAAERLRRRIVKFLRPELPPGAREVVQAEFVRLAARLRRGAEPAEARVESWSSRRAAVRRVEEFLDVHEHELPSLAELCAIAGVGERALEYAFREQLGLPPSRYVRLRRLNRARRELSGSDPETTRVTDVAMRWGFWQLGRFATEYRRLFGEHPSETLAGSVRRNA
jgi:AraC family ethanolamine operon transcriptional activator